MSAGKNIWATIGDMPPWGKAILVIGTGAIVTIVGFKIYNGIKSKKEEKDANKAGEIANSELGDLSKQGVDPTMSDSQFEGMAQSLVQAMNGCGTDEAMIYSVFSKIKNEADVRKMIAVFGVRYYEPCPLEAPASYTKYLFDDKAFGGGLPTWLSYDLSDTEIAKINAILKTNGLTYQF